MDGKSGCAHNDIRYHGFGESHLVGALPSAIGHSGSTKHRPVDGTVGREEGFAGGRSWGAWMPWGKWRESPGLACLGFTALRGLLILGIWKSGKRPGRTKHGCCYADSRLERWPCIWRESKGCPRRGGEVPEEVGIQEFGGRAHRNRGFSLFPGGSWRG